MVTVHRPFSGKQWNLARGIWMLYRYTTIWAIVVTNKAPIPNIDNNIPNDYSSAPIRTSYIPGRIQVRSSWNAKRICGRFAILTVRRLDISPPLSRGRFAPWAIRDHAMDNSPLQYNRQKFSSKTSWKAIVYRCTFVGCWIVTWRKSSNSKFRRSMKVFKSFFLYFSVQIRPDTNSHPEEYPVGLYNFLSHRFLGHWRLLVYFTNN